MKYELPAQPAPAQPSPQPRYLRAAQIHAPKGIIPCSRSHFWKLVQDKKFPPGTLLSPGMRIWSEADVLAFVAGEVR